MNYSLNIEHVWCMQTYGKNLISKLWFGFVSPQWSDDEAELTPPAGLGYSFQSKVVAIIN